MDLLTLLIFLPTLGGIILFAMPKSLEAYAKHFAFALSAIVFGLSLPLWFNFDSGFRNPESFFYSFQFARETPLLNHLNIAYSIGVDGISTLLVLLVTLLTPIVILSSYNYIQKRQREYFGWVLLLETGIIGALISNDMILFYLFWEAMLIPMFFIIGIWGGPRKVYATIKFVLFTMAGSLLMLVAMIYLAIQYKTQFGHFSFAFDDLIQTQLKFYEEVWLFFAFCLAFAIKVPFFPFHTWLPDAHVEAPTGGSVILAGVLLKMGTYGFLRISLPFFPAAAQHYASLFIILALIGIIYGALVAMVQEDVKKLVAYSSVSHLGFVMLGIFTFSVTGLQGGMYQMLGHGFSTGALFLLIGMLYERRHTREISQLGGLAKPMPVFTFLFLIVTLSSIGLPGLNGFIGEFFILLSAFKTNPIYGIFAATGIILGAVYMLWMFQRIFWGPLTREENKTLKDLQIREIALILPLIIFIFWMGLYTKPFISRMDLSIREVVERVHQRQMRIATWK